jgi:metal-responsive CopG/Arc/MetJ family transcriptional regulator
MENLTITLPEPLWLNLTSVSQEEKKTLTQLVIESLQKYLVFREWQKQGESAALRLLKPVSQPTLLAETEALALAVAETRAYRAGQ